MPISDSMPFCAWSAGVDEGAGFGAGAFVPDEEMYLVLVDRGLPLWVSMSVFAL